MQIKQGRADSAWMYLAITCKRGNSKRGMALPTGWPHAKASAPSTAALPAQQQGNSTARPACMCAQNCHRASPAIACCINQPTCAVPVCEAYSTTISLAGAWAEAALAARCALRRARMAAPPVAATGPGAAAGGGLAAAAGAAAAGAAVPSAAAAGAALAGAAAAAALAAAARWALKRAKMAAPPAAGAAGAAGAGTLACTFQSPCTGRAQIA